jgi:hypothetical protein
VLHWAAAATWIRIFNSVLRILLFADFSQLGFLSLQKRRTSISSDIFPKTFDIVLLGWYSIYERLVVSYMSEMMTVKEAAIQWNLTTRRISALCKDGKIAGAIKEGKCWLIPRDVNKPVDQRIKTGHYAKKNAAKLPLPIGVSSYTLASTEYYYIDKTLMLKDFIDERPLVTLFTRPRRFGKTLNMDMMRCYFEKSDEDTSIYFQNKKIWSCGQSYRDYQGKYPVIFLTFKDVKFSTWEQAFSSIRDIFARETRRHSELRNSDHCDEYSKKIYEKLAAGTVDEVGLSTALLDLSAMLHCHHGIAPVIIIDEYDTPIQQGYIAGYYDKIVQFMRNLFSGGFKDNPHLSFGFLTGILRVAKESIFSGMNNISINTVLDNKYSTYFGFTSDEVLEMAKYYGVSDKYDEICQWYDGYRFGKTEIFNPWSVVNYFSNNCEPKPYWVATGSNDIIGEVLEKANAEIYDRLTSLVNGSSFTTLIDTDVIYPQIKSNPSTIYSFLLVAGYLKVLKSLPSISGDMMCEVCLPNREISLVYNKEILQRLNHIIPPATAIATQEALFSGDGTRLKTLIQTLLTQSVSSFDAAGENFYHGFMLGLCALMGGFFVTSNRESGDGRYDIQLKPTQNQLPGILIELKADKNCSDENLKNLAAIALQQINDKKYDTEMRTAGITTIYKYGVAFSGKKVEVVVQ